MNTPVPTATCPECGAPLTRGAAPGLCPRCLMAGAMHPTEPRAAHVPEVEAVRAAFPQYEVLSLIGAGGMGAVFKARQPQLDRFVALKILAPERVDDPRFADRFQREAQALARLSHPHIVTIHDFGQAGGFYFLLMEFVDGVNLRQAMRAGRFTPEQALAIVPPVCEALQYAHEHGIVHRDIKPENLLLDKEGRVKIADFGIAKMLGSDRDTGVPPVPPTPTGRPPISQPTIAAGTPQYMAPEQRDHQRTDHRTDIYSLGVVLYEMLTGELPAEKLQPPSRRVQVDVRIDEIVLRALSEKPELRYQTAAEMRTQVETVAAETSPRAASNTHWAHLIETFFGMKFQSQFARRLANLSALGFLCFLGFVPLPGWQRCFGFAGLFGLIGAAFIVELGTRKRTVAMIATAALAIVIGWIVAVWTTRFLSYREPARAASSESTGRVESVVVTKEQAVIKQRRYAGEGLLFLFGAGTNRFTPGGLYIESMFDVFLKGHLFGDGADWIVKTRHGIVMRYRLDGPPGPMVGKLAFHPGKPVPDSDGSYVIGEFRPDEGAPLPIAVRLDESGKKTASSAPLPSPLKPIPPAVLDKRESVTAMMMSIGASRSELTEHPEKKQELENEIAAREQRLAELRQDLTELFRGTEAQPLLDRANTLLQEVKAAVEAKDSAKREAIHKEMREVDSKLNETVARAIPEARDAMGDPPGGWSEAMQKLHLELAQLLMTHKEPHPLITELHERIRQQEKMELRLQLRWVADAPGPDTEALAVEGSADTTPLHVKKNILLTGNHVQAAEATLEDAASEMWRIDVTLTADGAKRFATITGEGNGRRLAIVIDGKLVSAPVIREAVTGGVVVITGRFREEQARDTANKIRASIPAG